MLKFAKSAPYIPDPVRARPLILDEHRQQAAAEPPYPVPHHCKPWLDGHSIGWTLFYGYLTPVTIVGEQDGWVRVDNLERLAKETQQPYIVHQIRDGYFGLGIGYTLKTPPGLVSLIIPATQPPPGLELVTCLIETDWYPEQLFLVFRVPPPGERLQLDYKMELGRVVLVPRQDNLEAQPLTDEEHSVLKEREAAYLEEEKHTPTRWKSATGYEFTHLYKIWSRRYRREEPADQNEE